MQRGGLVRRQVRRGDPDPGGPPHGRAGFPRGPGNLRKEPDRRARFLSGVDAMPPAHD